MKNLKKFEKENSEGNNENHFQKKLLIARKNWKGSALVPAVVSYLIRAARLSFEPCDLYMSSCLRGSPDHKEISIISFESVGLKPWECGSRCPKQWKA